MPFICYNVDVNLFRAHVLTSGMFRSVATSCGTAFCCFGSTYRAFDDSPSIWIENNFFITPLFKLWFSSLPSEFIHSANSSAAYCISYELQKHSFVYNCAVILCVSIYQIHKLFRLFVQCFLGKFFFEFVNFRRPNDAILATFLQIFGHPILSRFQRTSWWWRWINVQLHRFEFQLFFQDHGEITLSKWLHNFLYVNHCFADRITLPHPVLWRFSSC